MKVKPTKFPEIDAIVEKYSEFVFRGALSHMITVGSNHFEDANVEAAKKSVTEQTKQLEAEGKIPWATERYQFAILDCAQELSKLDTWLILKYIKKVLPIG